jgi:hypothetical protein
MVHYKLIKVYNGKLTNVAIMENYFGFR